MMNSAERKILTDGLNLYFEKLCGSKINITEKILVDPDHENGVLITNQFSLTVDSVGFDPARGGCFYILGTQGQRYGVAANAFMGLSITKQATVIRENYGYPERCTEIAVLTKEG